MNVKTGKLLIIYGTSSAGKSSVGKCIRTLTDSLIIEDEDLAHEAYAVELMKNYDSCYYEILRSTMSVHDIFSFVLHGNTNPIYAQGGLHKISKEQRYARNFFKKNWNNIIQAKNPITAQHDMFSRAIKKANEGAKVLLFTSNEILLEQYQIMIDHKVKTIRILLFCPLYELCKRIIDRNSQVCNPINSRMSLSPVMKLSEYMQPIIRNDQVCVDELSYATTIKYINMAIQSIGCSTDYTDDITQIMTNLKLTHDKTTKIKYTTNITKDVLINTQRITPLLAAKEIIKFT